MNAGAALLVQHGNGLFAGNLRYLAAYIVRQPLTGNKAAASQARIAAFAQDVKTWRSFPVGDMDTTIDQTIEELREAAATLEQGGLPERFAAGHGIQSRRFRFEWQDEVLSLDFDLPCARLLSDEETQREEGAEAAAACRMGMLLFAARRDGTLLQEGEATLSATCGDYRPSYEIRDAEGEVLDSGGDWSPLAARLEAANAGASAAEATAIIWP